MPRSSVGLVASESVPRDEGPSCRSPSVGEWSCGPPITGQSPGHGSTHLPLSSHRWCDQIDPQWRNNHLDHPDAIRPRDAQIRLWHQIWSRFCSRPGFVCTMALPATFLWSRFQTNRLLRRSCNSPTNLGWVDTSVVMSLPLSDTQPFGLQSDLRDGNDVIIPATVLWSDRPERL